MTLQRFGSSQDDVGHASRCKKEAIGSQERDVETAEAAKMRQQEGPMPSLTGAKRHACMQRERHKVYSARSSY